MSSEFHQKIDLTPRRSKGGLFRAATLSATLALAALVSPGAKVQAEGIEFVDDGRFPQCTGIQMADSEIL